MHTGSERAWCAARVVGVLKYSIFFGITQHSGGFTFIGKASCMCRDGTPTDENQLTKPKFVTDPVSGRSKLSGMVLVDMYIDNGLCKSRIWEGKSTTVGCIGATNINKTKALSKLPPIKWGDFSKGGIPFQKCLQFVNDGKMGGELDWDDLDLFLGCCNNADPLPGHEGAGKAWNAILKYWLDNNGQGQVGSSELGTWLAVDGEGLCRGSVSRT